MFDSGIGDYINIVIRWQHLEKSMLYRFDFEKARELLNKLLLITH